MELLNLILLGLETISQLAVNPAFGLDADGTRVAGLTGTLATLGRRGTEALPELEAFVAEIRAIHESGSGVPAERWDEITARRHAQSAAIQG